MWEPTLSSDTGYVMSPASAEVSSASPGYAIHKWSELEVRNLRDADLVYVEKTGCRSTLFSRDIFDLFCAFSTTYGAECPGYVVWRNECWLRGLTTDVLIPQNILPSCMCFKHLVHKIALAHHDLKTPLHSRDLPCRWNPSLALGVGSY